MAEHAQKTLQKRRFTRRKMAVELTAFSAMLGAMFPDGVGYQVTIRGGNPDPYITDFIATGTCERLLVNFRHAWNLALISHNLGETIEDILEMMTESRRIAGIVDQ